MQIKLKIIKYKFVNLYSKKYITEINLIKLINEGLLSCSRNDFV